MKPGDIARFTGPGHTYIFSKIVEVRSQKYQEITQTQNMPFGGSLTGTIEPFAMAYVLAVARAHVYVYVPRHGAFGWCHMFSVTPERL